MTQQNMGRSLVLAASILGGCIVLAAFIFASGTGNSLSLFSRWSIGNQFCNQIEQALSGEQDVMGTKQRLTDVTVREVKPLQDGNSLYIVFGVEMEPSADFLRDCILNKQADGTYKGQCYLWPEKPDVKVSVEQ